MDETQGAAPLKKIRLQKGITLEQAQKDTRINAHILKALEGDGITDISPVYLKSFLRLYCKYLQVDPKDYAGEPRRTQYPASAQRPVAPPKVKPAKPEARAPQPRSPRRTFDIKRYIPQQAFKRTGQLVKQVSLRISAIRISPELKAGVVALCILVLVIGGLVKLGQVVTRQVKKFVAHRRSSITQTAAQPSQKKERGVVEASVPVQKGATDQEAVAIPEAGKDAPIRLVIRAQQNCWVYLKADGEVVFQRILEKGRFESWGAQERMELSLGNAGGVEIEVNGQLFKNLGRDRQALKSVVITKEGMQVN